jgi:hypothetical protein
VQPKAVLLFPRTSGGALGPIGGFWIWCDECGGWKSLTKRSGGGMIILYLCK